MVAVGDEACVFAWPVVAEGWIAKFGQLFAERGSRGRSNHRRLGAGT